MEWDRLHDSHSTSMCRNPGCCPLAHCSDFHFQCRRVPDVQDKQTPHYLILCPEFPHCQEMDCIRYHPERQRLRICWSLHRCEKWYCSLSHPAHRGNICLCESIECMQRIHRPRVDSKCFHLSNDVYAHMFRFCSFDEIVQWTCTCTHFTRQRQFTKSNFLKCHAGISSDYSYRILFESVYRKCHVVRIRSTYKSLLNIYYQLENDDGQVFMRYLHSLSHFDRTFLQDIPNMSTLPYHIRTIDGCSLLYLGMSRYAPLPLSKCIPSQKVDVLDQDGIWYEGTILSVCDCRIRIHFQGWKSIWDTWYLIPSYHVAPYRTFTSDWRTPLCVGDHVDICHHEKWYRGLITHVDHGETEKLYIKYFNITHELFYYQWVSRDSERLAPRGTHILPHAVDAYRYRMNCLRVPYQHRKDDPHYRLSEDHEVYLYLSISYSSTRPSSKTIQLFASKNALFLPSSHDSKKR